MYIDPPVSYVEPLFRPPSEAYSLILQVTNGCSWNKCSYCEMYTQPQKKFRPKAEAEVLEEIRRCGDELPETRRIFLADGDAFVLSFRRLKSILQAIREHIPNVSRVSAYCLPSNIKNKTVEELAELRELGLTLAYVGAESGDDTLLQKIDKGETYETTRDGLLKLKAAGVKSSVMIINGLGGKRYSEQHARESARLINETQPEYLATLVLFFRTAEQHFLQKFGDDFEHCEPEDLFREMEVFIDELDLKSTIFRSDHVSNRLILKGVLGKDKAKMLQQIHHAVGHVDEVPLRPYSGF